MKTILYLSSILSFAALCACSSMQKDDSQSANNNAVAEKSPDKMSQPNLADIKVKGYVGDKMDAFFNNRVFCEFAKKDVFGEAENAFRNKVDDESVYVGYWQGEFWGKLAISASRVYEYSQEKSLKDFISQKAAALAAMQEPDGYIGTYKNKTFLRVNDIAKAEKAVGWKCDWCWNLWCRKYTLWGLLEAYKVDKNPQTLKAAARFMDQYIDMLHDNNTKICDTGTFVAMPSMSVLKPLLILYRLTANDKYLDFAKEIVAYWDRDGNPPPNFLRNAFSDAPVRLWYPQLQKWEKAYEMMSCLEGLVEFHRITGDEKSLRAVEKIQQKLAADEKNILSSVGYNDMFVGGANNINAITEPCDAVHWMRLNRELFLASGDPKYLDEIEDTFYNAFMAGVARDGSWGARGVRSHGYHFVAKPQVGMKYNHCCVDNMPRGFLDFAQTAISQADGQVFVNFYSPFAGKIGGTKVEVLGNYPIDDSVLVKIETTKPTVVNFRIPVWSKNTLVNGKYASAGWCGVKVDGKSLVEIKFDMAARVIDSNLSDAYLAETDMRTLRWLGYDAAAGAELLPIMRHSAAATLKRGPLLLARSKYIGNSQTEMFNTPSINKTGAKCVLTKNVADKTWGEWNAKITTADGKTFETKVCDFVSAGNIFQLGSKDKSPVFSVFF